MPPDPEEGADAAGCSSSNNASLHPRLCPEGLHVHHLFFQPGFIGGEGHQVAFQGFQPIAQVPCFALQALQKSRHHPGIPAAVA